MKLSEFDVGKIRDIIKESTGYKYLVVSREFNKTLVSGLLGEYECNISLNSFAGLKYIVTPFTTPGRWIAVLSKYDISNMLGWYRNFGGADIDVEDRLNIEDTFKLEYIADDNTEEVQASDEEE
jgi:hypothetical protein